jgi:4-hydroxybenzoate polyprenyltransferase
LDVFAIATGFVLRAIAGAVVIEVKISPWLLVCTMLLALFQALSKRRHELILLADGATDHRKILKEYSSELVQEMISVVTSAVVVTYSLYTITAENVPKNYMMALTIPFVLYGIFRYLYLVYRKDEGGSPEELLLKDIPLLVDILLWGASSVIILYFFR